MLTLANDPEKDLIKQMLYTRGILGLVRLLCRESYLGCCGSMITGFTESPLGIFMNVEMLMSARVFFPLHGNEAWLVVMMVLPGFQPTSERLHRRIKAYQGQWLRM